MAKRTPTAREQALFDAWWDVPENRQKVKDAVREKVLYGQPVVTTFVGGSPSTAVPPNFGDEDPRPIAYWIDGWEHEVVL